MAEDQAVDEAVGAVVGALDVAVIEDEEGGREEDKKEMNTQIIGLDPFLSEQ